jgi:hypothetical protein
MQEGSTELRSSKARAGKWAFIVRSELKSAFCSQIGDEKGERREICFEKAEVKLTIIIIIIRFWQMISFRTSFLLLSALLLSPSLHADNWTETLHGDLSGLGSTPTFINFTPGSNLIEGSMGWNGSTLDADIWTFTIAAGYELTGINLVSYSGANPVPPNGHFMALAAGNTINTSSAASHLSNGLWTEELDINGDTFTDLFDILETTTPPFGGTGFTGALQAGNYTFWVQEGSNFVGTYCIDFVVTPVPEPGSALLLGAAAFFGLRRRRSSAK